MDQQFKFKIGQRVIVVSNGKDTRAYVQARTIEAALGKTYHIKFRNGRSGGFVPEDRLRAEEKK